MADEEKCCGKGEEHAGCAGCSSDDVFSYWCGSCGRSVADKRCPYCGLKAQKKKPSGAVPDGPR